jgi:hypothetical protein
MQDELEKRTREKNSKFSFNIFEKVSAVLLLFLVVLTFSIANIHALLWVGSEWLTGAVLPSVIVDLTNDERGDQKLGGLTRNPLLDEAAQLKAEDMAENGYFAHYSPEGVSPWYWFGEVGYAYTDAGENLAVHFNDSEAVVEAWMRSPLHRDNILGGKYTEIGVGTARGEWDGVPTVFVVQLFGSPAARTPVALKPAETAPVAQIAAVESMPDDGPQVLSESVTRTTDATAAPDTVPESQIVIEDPIEELTDGETAQQEVAVAPVVSENVAPVPTFSDLATTSDAAAAPIDTAIPSSHEATMFERGMVTPHALLNVLYALTALVIVVTLLTSMAVEWRRHHPAHIAYATALLAIMTLLSYVHIALTSGVLIV